MTTIEMTAEVREQAEAMLAELHKRGYRDIPEHRSIAVGTRIRHTGDRWAEAYIDGTGVVVALTEKPGSSWSASWHMPDIELIALWDRPDTRGWLSQLAQYHVDVIGDGR
jgi:hypothetical protein